MEIDQPKARSSEKIVPGVKIALGGTFFLDSNGPHVFFRLGAQPPARIAEQKMNFDYVFVSLAEMAREIRLDQFLTGMELENCG